MAAEDGIFFAITSLWGVREQWRQRLCSMDSMILLIIFLCCIYAILPSTDRSVIEQYCAEREVIYDVKFSFAQVVDC